LAQYWKFCSVSFEFRSNCLYELLNLKYWNWISLDYIIICKMIPGKYLGTALIKYILNMNIMKTKFVSFLSIIIVVFVGLSCNNAGSDRVSIFAGASECNITPPVGLEIQH